MATVKQLLEEKGMDVWSVWPDANVHDALKLMAEKDIGAVLVIDEEGKLAGIFSERDYVRRVYLAGELVKNLPIREMMTGTVYYVTPEHTTDDCMALMAKRHIRHLPVLENSKVIGVVSIGDVVKTIISEKEMVIEQLENYITGSGYNF